MCKYLACSMKYEFGLSINVRNLDHGSPHFQETLLRFVYLAFVVSKLTSGNRLAKPVYLLPGITGRAVGNNKPPKAT